SKPGPALRMSEGARLTVIRLSGNSKPELTSAARTRSRDSCTAASGRPTIVKDGRPGWMSASTVTGSASTPTSANVTTRASTGRTLGGRNARKKARPAKNRHKGGAKWAHRCACGPYRRTMAADARIGTGERGEAIAAALLERLGYTIVDRNFRTREGELDLVAVRG